MNIKKFFKNFIQEEEGATAVEYAVMLVLIIIVCIGAVTYIGTSTESAFNQVGDALNPAVSGS